LENVNGENSLKSGRGEKRRHEKMTEEERREKEM